MKGCKNCGYQMDDDMNFCQRCGENNEPPQIASVKKKKKKPLLARWWFWMLVCIALIIIVGQLGNSNDNETDTSLSKTSYSAKTTNTVKATVAAMASATTVKTTTKTPTVAMGDTVKLGNWEIVVESVEVKDKIMAAGGYGSYSPDEGNKYVVVHMTVKNTGKEMASFLPSFSTASDVRSEVLYQDEYSFSASQLLGESDDLHDSSVNPLSQKTGYIAFEIAEDAANSGELELRLTQLDDEVRIALQ